MFSFFLNSNVFCANCVLTEWFAFLGQKAPPGFPGSPYSINFRPSASDSSVMEPMNVSVYSCADTSLGCSCGDCPSAPACSNFEPPSPPKEEACTLRIGSLKVQFNTDKIDIIGCKSLMFFSEIAFFFIIFFPWHLMCNF